jgi:predicted NUDIX family phosphoesterase
MFSIQERIKTPMKSNSSNTKETVLCIKRSLLPETWLKDKSTVPMSLDFFAEICRKAGFEFIDRKTAEKQTDFKQIIPYIVLQTRDRKKTAIYSRHGSEKRLHNLWSAGIGGHINPIDISNSYTTGSEPYYTVGKKNFQEILMVGMQRELNEELKEKPVADTPKFIGIINEDITEVGKVHLGAVFELLTDFPETYKAGDELFQFNWMETKDLGNFNMELWSVLALELL